MAQIDTTLYKTIADAYALIDDKLSGISAHARTALTAILDVGSSNYPDPSADVDSALEIELALLVPFNSSYVSTQTIASNIGAVLDAVRTINNHVINNTAGSDTANVKLNTWVKTTMTSEPAWSIPAGWKNLCGDAGYDVSTW